MSLWLKRIFRRSHDASHELNHEFAIIGLGRFGASVGEVLTERGFTVLGIDSSLDLVQKYANRFAQTVRLDSTDPDALREVDIHSYPTVVVAIGSNLEASLLTIVALKRLEIPRIIAKATTKTHRDLLLSVGADRVVLPEYERGERLALELAAPSMADVLQVAEDLDIAALPVPAALIGQKWPPLETRVRLLGVERQGEMLDPTVVLRSGDQLIMSGSPAGLSAFIS